MASVVKVGQKWYAIYKNQYGIWTRKSGYTDKAMTMKLAQRLEDESQRVLTGDLDPAAEQGRIERAKPIESHIQQFENHIKSHKRTPAHIKYTIGDVRRFVEHSKVQHASAINIPMVDAWRDYCINIGYPTNIGWKASPDSVGTVNRRINSLKAFLAYLIGTGGVERNVLIKYRILQAAGHETINRRALTSTEAELLLEKTPDETRKLLYLFALKTGFRRSEIAAMTPLNFNFKTKTIVINARQSKRKSEAQQIPMNHKLIEPLQALCNGKNPTDKIFKINKMKLVKDLKSDCTLAGIDTTDIDFHALRHTFCSLIAANGERPEVLIKLARHKNLTTTMKYYVHVRPESESQAINKL